MCIWLLEIPIVKMCTSGTGCDETISRMRLEVYVTASVFSGARDWEVCSRRLSILLVVVDRGIPATWVGISIKYHLSCSECLSHEGNSQDSLVSISPGEVLRPNVLVWVLYPLLQWRHMRPMNPMLGPQIVGVDRRDDQAGNDGASTGSVNIFVCSYVCAARLTRWRVFSRDLAKISFL